MRQVSVGTWPLRECDGRGLAEHFYQIGVEALVPINRASGSGVGVVAQLHLYLDDIFPTTIGRPLFGGSSTPVRPVFGN